MASIEHPQSDVTPPEEEVGDESQTKRIGRRTFLKGLGASAAAAASGSFIAESKADDTSSGQEEMTDAVRELYGLDSETVERKAVIDIMEETKKKIKEQYDRAP